MTTFHIPIAPLLSAAVILTRVSFLLVFMPLFGESHTPGRVRVLLAVALTMILAPLRLVDLSAFPTTLPALIVGLAPEALIGLTLALVGRMIFGAVQFAGQLAGREMGFAMGNEIDPSSGIQITVVAQLQYAAAVVIFLASGAYSIFFQAIADSFRLIPPFGARATPSLFELVRAAAAYMFYLGLKLNFPIIGTMICVNVTFAMLAKAVPHLNIFIESFPVRILAGLFVLSVSMTFFASLVHQSFGEMDRQVAYALRALSP